MKREEDKTKELQDAVIVMREQLVKQAAIESRANNLKERLASVTQNNTELRNRVKSLEESSEHKDGLLIEWNQILTKLEKALGLIIEENTQMAREKEFAKSALSQLLKLVREGNVTDSSSIEDRTINHTSVLNLISKLQQGVSETIDKLENQREWKLVADERATIIKCLQVELAAASQQRNEMTLEIDRLNIALAAQKAEDKGEVDRLVSHVEKYQAIIEDQAQMVGKYSEMLEIKELEKTTYGRQTDELFRTMQDIEKENMNLKLALEEESAYYQDEKKKLDKKISSLKSENKDLKAKLSKIEDELEMLTTRDQRLRAHLIPNIHLLTKNQISGENPLEALERELSNQAEEFKKHNLNSVKERHPMREVSDFTHESSVTSQTQKLLPPNRPSKAKLFDQENIPPSLLNTSPEPQQHLGSTAQCKHLKSPPSSLATPAVLPQQFSQLLLDIDDKFNTIQRRLKKF